jgi:hypothetical protein
MGSPTESLEQKNVFAEKYDEIRRLDGKYKWRLGNPPFLVEYLKWLTLL